MVTRTFTVIAYDVSEDRRRAKLSNFLLRYGVRANYSVFECMLTEMQYQHVKQKVPQFIDLKTDRVLFYRICKSCYVRSEGVGRTEELPPDMVLEV